MNGILAFLFIALSISAKEPEFDFVFVHKAEGFNRSRDSVDYCKLIRDKKKIAALYKALEKSESEQFLCGFEYSFEFVKDHKVVSATWIQPPCEKAKLIEAIGKYFPDSSDTVFVYMYKVPSDMDPEVAAKKYGSPERILVSDERVVERWPYLAITYRFERKWSSFEESLKERKRVEKAWKKRREELRSLAKATFPNRAFYNADLGSSGGGPEKDYQDGFIKLRVYDSTELQKKAVFESIPELVAIKVEIPATYQLLLISNKKGLEKTDENIGLLNYLH